MPRPSFKSTKTNRRHSSYVRSGIPSVVFTNVSNAECQCDCQMTEIGEVVQENGKKERVHDHSEAITPAPRKKRHSLPMPAVHHVLIAFIVLIVVATTVSLAFVLRPKNDPRSRPNILVIIADDLGYNDVGYRGQGDIRTPYIDKLASSSILLERHYAQPMCSPSRAAMFTGRYPFRYGMGGSRAIYYGTKNGLNLNEKLISEALNPNDQEKNYNTYLIGKWHLGFANWEMTPIRRGFDYFYGTYGGSTTYFEHQSYEGPRSGSGYDLFEDTPSSTGTRVNHTVVEDPSPGTFSELLFTEKAVEMIEKSSPNLEGGEQEKPFFMVVSYQNPHAPITPMEADVEQNKHIPNENRRKMAAMITSLDYGVGRLTSALEKTHQLNQTIIIFLSDNGGHLMMPNGQSLGSSNLPLRGAKCTLYEGGVKTPAFIRIPHFTSGQMNSSLKYEGLFHISDWFPTIMRLAQLDPDSLTGPSGEPIQLDGIDHSEAFRELLVSKEHRRNAQKPRDHVVLDIDPVFDQAAIVRGKYKLIVGRASFIGFDQVYPLINEDTEKSSDLVINSSFYRTDPNMGERMMQYGKIQEDYRQNSSRCRSLDCMSKDMALYDLGWDVTESRDLSLRFKDETEQLYNLLRQYSNSTHYPVQPLYFEDSNPEAKTPDNVWTPWLFNNNSSVV